jgi:hypothetical protein
MPLRRLPLTAAAAMSLLLSLTAAAAWAYNRVWLVQTAAHLSPSVSVAAIRSDVGVYWADRSSHPSHAYLTVATDRCSVFGDWVTYAWATPTSGPRTPSVARTLVVRDWAIAWAGAILPTAWARSEWSRRRLASRRATGLCTRCGYDMTCNVSGRCPECGAAA